MNQSQAFTFMRTYSRWRDDLKRRETYEETGDRWLNFFQEELGDAIAPVHRNFAKKAWLNQEVMPSMRAAWAAGPAAKNNHITMYNCSFVVVNNTKVFSEILYILMCGTGVGFSVEKEYVDLLPLVQTRNDTFNEHVIVDDSKEGWANALDVVVKCLYAGGHPTVRLHPRTKSWLRLLTMGGRASGPEPSEESDRLRSKLFEQSTRPEA
jgi:ribonucleoside-triphosphate reductase